jgi:hypothetical protein
MDSRFVENVIRFPVEERQRATLELLAEIQPRIDVLDFEAERHGLEAPDPGLRDRVDAEMAEYIAERVPLLPLERRRALLRELLDVRVRAAVKASWAWRRAEDQVAELSEVLDRIPADHFLHGEQLVKVLAARRSAVILALEAYRLAAEAWGANRAIGYALRGERWTAFDADAAMAKLLA